MGKRKSSPRLATTSTIWMLLILVSPKFSFLFKRNGFQIGLFDYFPFQLRVGDTFEYDRIIGYTKLSINVVKI